MAKKDLFAKKKTTKKATAKKDTKIIVDIPGTDFAENLEKFASIKSKMDDLKADLAMAQSFVKDAGVEAYVALVEKNKSNSGSIILSSETGGNVMFSPTKKYIKIDEDQADELIETYGDDIVTETTDYGFDTEVLMRNMDTISEIIMGSDLISEEDKEDLIVATTTYAIKKDTLDKVYTLSQESKNSVSTVIEDIQPVMSLKNAKTAPIK